jgi:hypothetical protein
MRALTRRENHVKTATTALVALVALGSFSTACSSSSKQEQLETGTALSALRSPTGSFSKETGASAFAGYRSKRVESSKVATPASGAPGGDTSNTRSIRLLDRAASSSCTEGQACACPSGGTMSYRAQSSDEGQLLRVSFEACGFEDGYGFDGDAILLASTKSLLGISEDAPAKPASPPKETEDPKAGEGGGLVEAPAAPSGGTSGSSKVVSALFAAKGTMTDGARKLPLEFALLTEAHYVFLAVSVPDGNIVIGISDQGYAMVRSKEGTWKCKTGGASRGWTCTSDHGESLELEDDGATAGEGSATPGPAPAPAPSAPSDESEG